MITIIFNFPWRKLVYAEFKAKSRDKHQYRHLQAVEEQHN